MNKIRGPGKPSSFCNRWLPATIQCVKKKDKTKTTPPCNLNKVGKGKKMQEKNPTHPLVCLEPPSTIVAVAALL